MIETKPDYWEGYLNLGYFLITTGREEDAAEQYKHVLELAPNDSYTLNNLGNIYHSRGEWSRARELYLRSFAVKPLRSVCQNIGTMFYFDGRFEDAAQYFRLAMEYADTTAAVKTVAAAGLWGAPLPVELLAAALERDVGELGGCVESAADRGLLHWVETSRPAGLYVAVGGEFVARAWLERFGSEPREPLDLCARVLRAADGSSAADRRTVLRLVREARNGDS